MVKERRVRRLLNDVYVDGLVGDSIALRCAAVGLVLPPGAVVCRRTAAWLHGVDLFGPAGELESLTVDCLRANPDSRIRRRGVRGYVGEVEDDDLVMVGGIPVTTPVRTGVDLARWLWRPNALAAIDAMAHAGLVTRVQLADYAAPLSGYRWIAQARELISIVEPKTESPGESWTRLRIIDAGLPAPEAQISITLDGTEIWRLDLGYRPRRVGLEYNGFDYHGSPLQQERDRIRQVDLRDRFRWDLYSFDRHDVWGPNPIIERTVGELLGIEPLLPRLW